MTAARSRIVFPMFLSAALLGLYWVVKEHPIRIGGYGDVRETIFGANLQWLVFVALVPLIVVTVRVLDALTFDVVMSRRGSVAVPRLLRDLVGLVVYFLLFSWAASVLFGHSLTRWLTATTVVAAVLGLALQETLGNLFSGIALHLEDTFEVGDVIRSGDYVGVVEGLNWRSTRIRAFSGNNVVILPNSVLARERFEVYPRRNLNARVIQVGIDYNTPPAVAIPILTQAAANVEGVSREMLTLARVQSFGDSSVVYDVKYFTREYEHRDRIDADVKKAIWYALKRNSISIPFPIRSFAPYQPPTRDDHNLPADAIRLRLHNVDILSPLGEGAQEALAEAAQVHYYSRGETIIRFGTAGASMFIVHDGQVSVRITDDSSAGKSEVAQLGPGTMFGEMALLTGETRTADVVAITDVTAIEIGKDALQPILMDHPDLAAAISSRVTERKMRLNELRASPEEEERTIRSRILAYFGLR